MFLVSQLFRSRPLAPPNPATPLPDQKTTMRHLPDELVLHIISFLNPEDLVALQRVSTHFLNLARDNNTWKHLCFEHSAAERRRRRLESASAPALDPRLAELLRAADSIPGAFTPSTLDSTLSEHNASRRRAALLANWDPAYPGEKIDFYAEYIHRHAPHALRWFQAPRHGHGHADDDLRHEATGAGILYDADGVAEKLVAPLDDGSIALWEASPRTRTRTRYGRIAARSRSGLLTNSGTGAGADGAARWAQSQSIMTETGAVECVSVDSTLGQARAFFAVQNVLNEVDLNTLDVVARTPYPFPITALSAAAHPTPLTVGTNWTVHLHDARVPPPPPSISSYAPARCELIAGTPPSSSSFSRLHTSDFGAHASLAQPGALSILHLPSLSGAPTSTPDIFLAGRFTSILHFDRRTFPRLRSTLHSGARLASLTALPHPFIPASASPAERTAAKADAGYTLVAGGEYKGKGSLETYGVDADGAEVPRAEYRNRQTASASKVLAVAAHGARLVYADGEGNVKWVERDARAGVRGLNVNVNEGVGGREGEGAQAGCGDIVQKIMPVVRAGAEGRAVPLGRDGLVVWTGEGRLGVIEVGGGSDEAEGEGEDVDGVVEEARERELRSRERQYGVEMRRALEQQARELRWLRGYGL